MSKKTNPVEGEQLDVSLPTPWWRELDITKEKVQVGDYYLLAGRNDGKTCRVERPEHAAPRYRYFRLELDGTGSATPQPKADESRLREAAEKIRKEYFEDRLFDAMNQRKNEEQFENALIAFRAALADEPEVKP